MYGGASLCISGLCACAGITRTRGSSLAGTHLGRGARWAISVRAAGHRAEAGAEWGWAAAAVARVSRRRLFCGERRFTR